MQDVKPAEEQHQITKNVRLLNDLRESFGLEHLNDYPINAYEHTELQKFSEPYNNVCGYFKARFHQRYKISKITEVKNTFLTLQYNLMTEKYRDRDESVRDETMFHGTDHAYLNNICTYNFDRSKVIRHRYGHGISFAKDSYFAARFPLNNRNKHRKIMIMANVLVGALQTGVESMIIPTEPCYTSHNSDRSIYVKYDDASSYPAYIVYYERFYRNIRNVRNIRNTRDICICNIRNRRRQRRRRWHQGRSRAPSRRARH